MNRNSHGNDGDGHDVHGAFQAMPLLRIPLPSERQKRVKFLAPAVSQVASRGSIGNDRQKKKNHAARQIGEDGDKIPQQRRAKIWPDVALARIRHQPEEKPRPSQVADRYDRANGERENRDCLGATRDWSAPSRIRQAQNRGDQRAGVADADPENEIGNVESPEHRPVQAPHAKAVVHLITESKDAGQNHAAANAYGQPVCGAAAEDGPQQIGANLFSRFCHFPRIRAGGNSRSVSCRARQAASSRVPTAPGAKLRYSGRLGRQRPWPWARTIARKPD